MTIQKVKKVRKADFCIIGAGSGGLSFAATAVQMGASVILIERDKMGGDCLNYGCIPSKALIAASKFAHEFQRCKAFGWKISKPQVDFKMVHNHIHETIQGIAPHDSVERFEKLGVKVIHGTATFRDKNTVESQNHIIQAKRFIIATGSRPFVPPIEGLSKVPFYTNESIFDLKELPEHLVIIGGGPIGIEMAQAFRRFGSQVTILEAYKILPKDDFEFTSTLKEILRNENILVEEQVKIDKVILKEKQLQISYKDANEIYHTLKPSHILVAAGRQPSIDTLMLNSAEIKYDKRGIQVDPHLKTTNPIVYAIGDCTGGYQFTHVAGYHAGLAIRNTIFGLRAKVQTCAIPWVTYTDPELAQVGATEAQLLSQGEAHKVLRYSFEDNDRAQTDRNTVGKIKILVTPRGHILGVTILGAQAGELIFPWVLAIQNRLKISAIANVIAPYPTLSEINKRAASAFYVEKLFSPMVKKIVKGLMKLRN